MNDIFDKFPPDKKDEFLKWVMITQPKGEWYNVVCGYMDHHQIKNWSEGLQFIIKWTSNPPWIAYAVAKKGHAPSEWAMKIIENDKTGDPSWAAYMMVKDGLTNDIEWAMKIIENDKTDNPSMVAYWVVQHGYAPQKWYDKHFREK